MPRGRPKGIPRTGGRKKGVPNKATADVRLEARRIVDDPEYRANLAGRMKAGTASPGVEMGLWAYAYGKPREHHLHELVAHQRVIEVITVGSSNAMKQMSDGDDTVIEVG